MYTDQYRHALKAKMSFSKYAFEYLLAVQLVAAFYMLSANASFFYQLHLVDKCTQITGEGDSVPKTGVCDLGLPARRERCKLATTSNALSEYKSKVIFGAVPRASVYEFEYSSPVNGNSKVKKWAFKCATKPLMYIVDGDAENNYDIMIPKDSPEISKS